MKHTIPYTEAEKELIELLQWNIARLDSDYAEGLLDEEAYNKERESDIAEIAGIKKHALRKTEIMEQAEMTDKSDEERIILLEIIKLNAEIDTTHARQLEIHRQLKANHIRIRQLRRLSPI